MTNREIAKTFNFLGNIMDLHDENQFKIRSYYNAYNTLRKIGEPLSEMSIDQIQSIPGVGKAIGEKIIELLTTGKLNTLEKYKDLTPIGVQEMLKIRGLGPKKIKTIWKDLGIEEVGDLLYACNENRLVAAKGFGLKTQLDIRQKLELYADSQGKFLYGFLIDEANKLIENIKMSNPDVRVCLVGGLAMQDQIVDGIALLVSDSQKIDWQQLGVESDEESGELVYSGYPVAIHEEESSFGRKEMELTSSPDFFSTMHVTDNTKETIEVLFAQAGLPYVPAFYRSSSAIIGEIKENGLPRFIQETDIRGVVHNHSTYSDGIHTLEEMTKACMQLGYEYFVISDHSKSAGYAQGLSYERVEMQWREINDLNKKLSPFHVYKSIESDILSDGSLDYEDDFLKGFDLVIASIHSVLNMDIEKATSRIIKAIEHPSTRILGHPTGRLLLGRRGYPLHFDKVIDACAANNVVIELNANPQRLDVDYSLIPQILDKGVKVAINPDAHSTSQIQYIKYGIAVAQKVGLSPKECINTYTKSEFDTWLAEK